MGRRKCTPKQLEALRRGREKLAHKRSKKRTNFDFKSAAQKVSGALKSVNRFLDKAKARAAAKHPQIKKIPLNKTTPIPAPTT